jgi:hypothetical protein
MNLATHSTLSVFNRIRIRPGLIFVLIMLVALIAFEMFNYSTTDYALNDLLGNLKFAGINWSTILAIAFCGIDFAGIARLFTPEQGMDEPKEVWYLFGAWLLAATMNTILTWWGVSMAIVNHSVRSSALLDPNTLIKIVPVFIAVMVWVIRVLIIGTLSVASDRLMNGDRRPYPMNRGRHVSPSIPAPSPALSSSPALSPRPSLARAVAGRPGSLSGSGSNRPEPSYQPLNSPALSALPALRADPSAPNNERRM